MCLVGVNHLSAQGAAIMVQVDLPTRVLQSSCQPNRRMKASFPFRTMVLIQGRCVEVTCDSATALQQVTFFHCPTLPPLSTGVTLTRTWCSKPISRPAFNQTNTESGPNGKVKRWHGGPTVGGGYGTGQAQCESLGVIVFPPP